jgi:hypothetical protein
MNRLSKHETRWIQSISMPILIPTPERCKTCRHYAHSVKASDDLFIDGEYCVHFDNECYWDSQKEARLSDVETCPSYQKREEGVTYLREDSPMVVKGYWLGY